MSSYVNFYLRINDLFVPIGSYSRSSEMYQTMYHYCPYGKIKALTKENLYEVINDLETRAQRIKDFRAADEKRCDMIMQANNALEEKMEAISDIMSGFNEMDTNIKEVSFSVDTLRVFSNMIEEFSYNNKFSNDYNHYLYAGIEADGTLENII